MTTSRAWRVLALKKAEKALKEAKTKEQLLQAAWEKYQEHGHTMEYFTEQGQLLWLRREENELWQPLTIIK